MKKIIFGIFFIAAIQPYKLIAQVLETEESRPLFPGQFDIGTGFEFQISKEGTESALPLAIEYGLAKKITLLVEPVGFTSIRPKIGNSATGIGDVEVTVLWQIIQEKKIIPSISISTEIKIPTAQSKLIGTGKTDFTPYLIASKSIGKFFASFNFSYTFLGKPAGIKAKNLVNYAIGTIYSVAPRHILFAEFYGNSSAFGEGEVPEPDSITSSNINLAEISGGETVGAFGYGFYLKHDLLISLGISYDNNNAILFRPGIEWKFGVRK
jgi:hypothetical protein